MNYIMRDINNIKLFL